MTELGDFLRAKRAALSPESAGIGPGDRPRRVPGLRREEVALLADVGVDHYTRLEQGRTTGVSEAVLAGIARALRLNPDEQSYLLALANPPKRACTQPSPQSRVSTATQALLDTLSGAPALVLGRRMDILAWNPLAAALFVDFAELRPEQRNLARLLFLDPRVRNLFGNWDAVAIDSVSRLRMEAATNPHDQRLTALIGELSVQDEDFRRWWRGRSVKAIDKGRKTFQHPVAGPLELDWQALQLTAEHDQTLIVYTAPPSSNTARALQFLHAWTPGRPAPYTPSESEPLDQRT